MATVLKSDQREYKEDADKIDSFRIFREKNSLFHNCGQFKEKICLIN
jgi:hypothetical protein